MLPKVSYLRQPGKHLLVGSIRILALSEMPTDSVHVRLSGHIGSDRRTVKTTRMTLSGRAHTLEDEVWRAGGDDTSQCQADRIKEIAKFSLRSALPSGDSQPEHVG